MSNLVPAEDIERIVGVARHQTKHYGRADSAEETVYVLHSRDCKDSGIDLRDCPYSIALDRGIHMDRWSNYQDRPMELWVSAGNGRLVPMREVD